MSQIEERGVLIHIHQEGTAYEIYTGVLASSSLLPGKGVIILMDTWSTNVPTWLQIREVIGYEYHGRKLFYLCSNSSAS